MIGESNKAEVFGPEHLSFGEEDEPVEKVLERNV
jgi:hypothetical protein